MSAALYSTRELSRIGTKAQEVANDSTLSNTEKMTVLKGMQSEMDGHRQVVEAYQKSLRLMVGGESLNSGSSVSAAYGIAAKGAAVPSLSIPDEHLNEAFLSIKGGGNFRAELGMKDAASSTATAGQLPPQLIGLVDKRFEPSRILDHLLTTSTSAPSVEFLIHSANSANAAAVAAGAAMPESSLTTTQAILKLEKIGIYTTLTDELIADYSTFRDYVSVELQRQIVDAENAALLNGSGTSPQIRGLLNTSGVLTRAKGTDSNLDVIEQGIMDLRTGSSFCEPDALIVSPQTWSIIRRAKNTQGNYILGDPGQSTVNDVWGIPVVQTTQIAAGTAVLANLHIAATAFIRQGVTLEMTNSGGTDFESGKVKVRATERLTLGVQRPSAVNILTALA
ncbi:phage major capsid protein [Pseudarthrobacter sp. P1]|uniref:phage major capsid protein n=1 Tax=Pseudarthrobacter sp. P1 TaxID=3418418 RepID=UPI003CED86D8